MKVLDAFIRRGHQLWTAAYRENEDVEALHGRLESLVVGGRDEARENPGGFLTQYVWPTVWYEYGLQRFEIGAKFAASLVCTAARATDVDVRMPFPAFLIQLPEGVFASQGQPISFLTLLQYGDALHVGCFSGANGASTVSTVFMIKVGAKDGSLGGLIHEGTPEEIEASLSDSDRWSRDASGVHERCREALSRVVFGVGAYLQGGGAGAPVEELPRRVRTNERGESLARTHRLSPVVHTDCREHVQRYLRGERPTVPHVRTLVMGHYKHQPHGPSNRDRKLLWIQPHWRGPEDAPLAVRPHRVESSEGR